MKANTSPFNVILIGAGEINFGSVEGPWNHSARLEAILGTRLQVFAVVDPNVQLCRQRIIEREASHHGAAWQDTVVAESLSEARDKIHHSAEIHLIVLGCPPHYRGTSQQGKDMDLQIMKYFPKVRGILIEKPIAAQDPFDADCSQVNQILKQRSEKEGTIISVGYMLRYLSAVEKIKKILLDHSLTPTCINARYYMAYQRAQKLSWWDKEQSCGPVVEQATHFVDLIRYIAGEDNEYIPSSIKAISVEHSEEAGRLSRLGIDESTIDTLNRIPRVTNAFWKHRKGTIGTLCHAITLHDCPYGTELEVLADGWVIKLKEAYSKRPTLSILGPDVKEAEVIAVEDDPFSSEMQAIIDAIDKPLERSKILCSFEDALETYNLTWQIRRASEA